MLRGDGGGDGEDTSQPVFYYDLGSPDCYLVAEQISVALPIVAEWEPVLGTRIIDAQPAPDRELIARTADALGLLPVRWPRNWPPDTALAIRAATYAKRIGRTVAFSLAAFRQAFAAGRDLAEQDTVLIAAAACEMHPTAMLKGIALRSVTDALERATERALRAGARSLPAIQVGEQLFEGAGAIEAAAQALERAR